MGIFRKELFVIFNLSGRRAICGKYFRSNGGKKEFLRLSGWLLPFVKKSLSHNLSHNLSLRPAWPTERPTNRLTKRLTNQPTDLMTVTNRAEYSRLKILAALSCKE